MASDFLTTYAPLANDIATRTGLDPAVVLGIIDTETGGGVHVKGNNIFGISPSGPNGQYVASYPDVQTASQAFISLIQTPRYRGVTASSDPAAQAVALVRGGYNTANPNYASIVANKAKAIGSQLGYQGDEGGPQQPVALMATSAQPAAAPAPAAAPPPVGSYSFPAPTGGAAPPAAAAPAGSEKDRALSDPALAGGDTTTAPAQTPAAAPATTPKSAKDQALSDPALQPTATPPPAKPDNRSYSADNPAGNQGGAGGSAMPSTSHLLRDVVMAGEGLPAPSMAPAPGALMRVLGAAYEGGHTAPDASGWAPGGVELGRYIVNPLLATAGAAFRGGQQFLAEATEPIGRDIPLVGHPGLGRDVAALPEAFPTGEYGQPTRPANALERRPPGPAQTAEVYPPVPSLDPRGVPIRDFTPPPGAKTASYTPSDRPPSTGGPGPADRSAGIAPPPTGGTTGLENLGGAATAMGDNLRDMLWSKLQKGDTTELGRPSQILTDAKAAMDQGVIKSRADFDAWTQQWGAQRRGARDGGASVPQPAAAGADITREPIPDKTREQKATDIRKDVGQTARARAGDDALRDDEAYFQNPPGATPFPERPEALRDFSPQTALDHEYYYSKDPAYREAYDQNRAASHRDMTDWIKEEIGDDNTVRQLKDYRREVTPEKMKVFTDEKPVDPAMLEAYRKRFEEVVNGLDKRDLVRPILEKSYAKLFDKDGNIETLPSRLQKVRDNMTDQLELRHGSTDLSTAVRTVQHELTELVDGLNPVMTSGAPKWDAWRQAWAERSQAINRQEFLQNYDVGRAKSLWDKNGRIQPHKIEKLLSDIANAHSDFPVHDAHSMTDAQIRKIVEIRNEVATEALLQSQAKLAHSPTARLQERAAKEGGTTLAAIARHATDVGAHTLGAFAASKGYPFLNTIYGTWQSTRPLREMRKGQKTAAQLEAQSNALKEHLLSTPSSRARNALQP